MERDIDYVIAVAECGSISQAAEMLYISQPSLSRYLSSLENELGVTLFVRTTTGTELTDAGKIYVEYAKEIKRLRSAMQVELRAFQRAKASRIRVGMTLTAIFLSSVNVSEEVKKRYPECDVEIFNILSRDIPALLRENTCDFVIGPALSWSPEFVCQPLCAEQLILVVPKRYDLTSYAVQKNLPCFH